LAGFLLRLYGIDDRGMSHPELYIPGIELIPGISAPPPRIHFGDVLHFHFHTEPHPMGFYLLGYAWTSLFGIDIGTLRLPSAILGGLTVWLVWRLGRMHYGNTVGLVAALLLAAHGYHLLWSQLARMYAPGTFCAVLATLLLVVVIQDRQRRLWPQAAYVVSLFLGTQMTQLFWGIAFLHVGWLALVLSSGEARFSIGNVLFPWKAKVSRVAQLQALALMASAPALTHVLYRAREGAVDQPGISFILDYFGFGFLFSWKVGAAPYEATPIWMLGLLAACCLALVFVGSRSSGRTTLAPVDGRPIRFLWLTGTAILSGAVIVWLASIAHRRNEFLLATAVLPLLCLWVPALVSGFRQLADQIAPWLGRLIERFDPVTLLFLLIALVPATVFFAFSFAVSVAAARAFLVFVPFLLLLTAAGLVTCAERLPRSLTLGGAAAVALLWAGSIDRSWQMPYSPRAYDAIAAHVAAHGAPGDPVFIRARHWADTPIMYHLKNVRYVAENYEEMLREPAVDRVWAVDFQLGDQRSAEKEWHQLLVAHGFREESRYTARRGLACLYVRSVE